MRIVYLSRGHGYGHAATDREITEALCQLRPGITIELASYGTGLKYYSDRGIPCADLRIDDIDDQGLQAALRVMAFLHPRRDADLVVAHEIFTAPQMCATLDLPNVLLTHWFFAEVGAPQRDALLAKPDALVLLDFEAAHQVPPQLAGRAQFTGAVARSLPIGRDQARYELGIADTDFVAVLVTGAVTPINADHVSKVVARGLGAWRARGGTSGRLLVLSEVAPPPTDPSVTWVGRINDPSPYYRAADVVVAGATFSTLCVLARNGIPTVAVTGGQNPVDQLHARFFASEGLVRTVDVSASEPEFWDAVQATAAASPDGARLPWATPEDVARRLLHVLD